MNKHPFTNHLLTSSSCPLLSSLQTKLLTQYILNLGKYDQSYDIRDRTRFIRQLIVPSEKSGALNKYARRILLAPKPAPVLESTFKGISYIWNISLLSQFWNILKSYKGIFSVFHEWLYFKQYAYLIRAVVILFWCVCVSRAVRSDPLYLGLMRWINNWANTNLFTYSEGKKYPWILSLWEIGQKACTTLKFRGSLHLLDVYGKR